MKLYRTAKVLQGQVQGQEFVAARDVRACLDYIQEDDFPVAGWNPNVIEEVGEIYVADSPKVNAKIVKFVDNDEN